MSRRWYALAAWLTVMLGGLFAPVSAMAAEEFDPADEFALPPWIEINVFGIDMSINKAVAYVFIAAALTTLVVTLIARRMKVRPESRTQTTVEMAYGLMKDNITDGNLDPKMAARWFPFIGTLFLFIWFSNMIGYIPLPFNTTHTMTIAGVELPTFALAFIVWISYNVEGIRAKGVVGYVRGWVPAGVEGFMVGPILLIEVLSHFVRLISLSVRLYANILAGHLLLLFMGGGLVVLLGMGVVGSTILGLATGALAVVFFLFEIGLVATLQAFIFCTLTAIYLDGAVAEEH